MGNSSSKGIFRAVLLGLDAAGKTTVLTAISGKQIPSGPTIEHNFAKISIPRGTVVVWDVGGQERLRALWRSVYYGTGAIIFVVDSTDVQRLETARVELHALLKEQELVGVPVLVLANKQDAVGALDMEGVRETLKLEALRPRTVSVLATSAASGSGIPAVVEWLGKQVLSPKDIPKHAAEQARLALQMEAEYEAEVSRQSRQST